MFLAKELQHAWHDRHMRPGENRKANYLNIFLHRGVDDHFWRLPEASVDDLHTRVAKCSGNYLGASIVAIQPRLGDKYPDSTLHPLFKV